MAVQRHQDHRIGEMLLLLQVIYLTIAGKVLVLFDCTTLADGSLVLEAAPFVKCWEAGSEHNQLVVMGFIAVGLYVVDIPVLFWRVLAWARRQLEEQAREAVAPAAHARLSPAGRARLSVAGSLLTSEQRDARAAAGNLSPRFRADKCHWLLVVMARKLALVTSFVFFSSRPQTQRAMVAFVLLVALELQHRHKPYADVGTASHRDRQLMK